MKTQFLVAFKAGKKVAEYPLTDKTMPGDVAVILRVWEEEGRTWEYQAKEVKGNENKRIQNIR